MKKAIVFLSFFIVTANAGSWDWLGAILEPLAKFFEGAKIGGSSDSGSSGSGAYRGDKVYLCIKDDFRGLIKAKSDEVTMAVLKAGLENKVLYQESDVDRQKHTIKEQLDQAVFQAQAAQSAVSGLGGDYVASQPVTASKVGATAGQIESENIKHGRDAAKYCVEKYGSLLPDGSIITIVRNRDANGNWLAKVSYVGQVLMDRKTNKKELTKIVSG